MKFLIVPVSTMFVNSYIYFDENTREAAIIDPGKDENKLMEILDEKGLVLKEILLTHGHFDHISAVNPLREATKAPVCAHADEVEFLLDPLLNESKRLGWFPVSVEIDKALNEGDIVEIGEGKLSVIHTPGHTKGGICFYDKENGLLFSGDSIFYGSVGRSDFSYGDGDALIRGLKEKILTLDDDVKVLPGHGSATTIGYERNNNPFLRS